MSDAFSDYLEAKILNWALRAGAMGSAPATVYVALHVGDPGDTGAANELTIGALAYARVAVSTTGGWSAPDTASSSSNVADVTFPTAAGGDWGTVTHFSIWDAASAGNCLFKDALVESRSVLSGDTFRFPAGELVLTVA